jgi:hypothetical protein
MGRYTAQINQKRLHSSMRTLSVKKKCVPLELFVDGSCYGAAKVSESRDQTPPKRFRSDRSWFLKRICCVLP